MMRGMGFLAFAIVALLAACSSEGQKGDGGSLLDGSGGTQTETGHADAADMAPATPDAHDAAPDLTNTDRGPATPIWTDGSAAIDVLCAGFHEGQMRFRARRDQMSGEQLALLAQVTTTSLTPPDACTPDVMICTIAITGAGGGTSTYQTFAFDQSCGSPDNLVANATFRPFAATLPCRYGREGTLVGGGGPPPFAPDERCFNGILGIGGVGAIVSDPVLAVSEAGVTRHIEIDRCSPTSPASLALDILTADGTTSVAQGMPVAVPGADETCLRVDHAFAAAGNYRLHLSNLGSWVFYRFF